MFVSVFRIASSVQKLPYFGTLSIPVLHFCNCCTHYVTQGIILSLFQVKATTSKMALYVVGLVGIVVFYIAMLGVGIWAGTKQKNQSEEEIMLAGRSLGTVVGFLTLIGVCVCVSVSFLYAY